MTQVVSGVDHQVDWVLYQPFDKALLSFLPWGKMDVADLQYLNRATAFREHLYGFFPNNK